MIRDRLIVALSTLVLGMGGFEVSAQTALQQCASEDCACEEALKQNTVEALEAFLKKYPLATSGSSACSALAVPWIEGPEGDASDTTKQSQPHVSNEG